MDGRSSYGLYGATTQRALSTTSRGSRLKNKRQKRRRERTHTHTQVQHTAVVLRPALAWNTPHQRVPGNVLLLLRLFLTRDAEAWIGSTASLPRSGRSKQEASDVVTSRRRRRQLDHRFLVLNNTEKRTQHLGHGSKQQKQRKRQAPCQFAPPPHSQNKLNTPTHTHTRDMYNDYGATQ